jgi:hypothetical protein
VNETQSCLLSIDISGEINKFKKCPKVVKNEKWGIF